MERARLDEWMHTQASKTERASIIAAAAADRSVSPFISRAVLRDAKYQEVAKRTKEQFRKTMASRLSEDEVTTRFKGQK